jgi:hypothetical protein
MGVELGCEEVWVTSVDLEVLADPCIGRYFVRTEEKLAVEDYVEIADRPCELLRNHQIS